MSGQEMAKEAGTTQFDPDIIEALCHAINLRIRGRMVLWHLTNIYKYDIYSIIYIKIS